MKRLIIFLVLLGALAHGADAQPAPAGLSGGWWEGGACNLVTFSGPNGPRSIMVDANGNQCITGSVTTTPGAVTWQATMTLAAATSTTLVDANVTKAPNSAATPASFGLVTIINTGANSMQVCEFAGTCSATAGGSTIAAGACDTFNISPASVPTLFSTSGTTLSFRNGPGC